MLLIFAKLLLAMCGAVIAWYEGKYIIHYCSRSTPLLLTIASSMQAAGAALFLVHPCLCAALVIVGRAVFAWYGLTTRKAQ